MINEKIIIQKMNEDLESIERNRNSYADATNINDERLYWNQYLRDCSSYNARYETILLFGYDVLKDDNNKIVGLKSIYTVKKCHYRFKKRSVKQC